MLFSRKSRKVKVAIERTWMIHSYLTPSSLNVNELSYKIAGLALALHRAIDPGLFESADEMHSSITSGK